LTRFVILLAVSVLALPSRSSFAVDLGEYKLVWHDEFDGPAGSRPSKHWFFFGGWGAPDGKWRDAYYTDDNAYLDGDGHLVLRARIADGKLMTSYIQTYSFAVPRSQWTTFGPGKGKYIEARVDLSQMRGRGPWAGFWLFDPIHAYDGNPATGTEMDVMEYVRGDTTWDNRFNVATHWGGPNGSAGRIVDVSDYGGDLRSGYHTFGLEWHPDRLTYYFDGKPVWTTTDGVSTSDEEALILSIEYQLGSGGWGINQDALAGAAAFPDYFIVDYVRVYDQN
jgi:beta-glucanase (GH16 family)